MAPPGGMKTTRRQPAARPPPRPEAAAAGGDEAAPPTARRPPRLQHVGGAADVDRGVEGRIVQRSADVDLGGQVEYPLRLALAREGAQLPPLADVQLDQRRSGGEGGIEVGRAARR